MARLITASLVALQLLAIAGCGGGGGTLTQEDLKRRAIKRKKPEEPSSPAVQTPVATQPVANAVAVTHATAATNRSSPPASNSPAGSSPATDAPAVANTTATPTQTVGTPTTTAPASGGLPPVVQPPAVPLSPTEAMQRSADNMTQINTAIMTYVKTKGRYPPPAIGNGGPMLSWRVAILPLLGHKALYDQFNLDEPWNLSLIHI